MKDKMMNANMGADMDVENVGIMQGFLDSMDDGDDTLDSMEEGDDYANMERRPDSPEILMNNLRGDMRSIEARRDELADLVGYAVAAETPEPVLAMLQPVLAAQGPMGEAGAGIGALPPSMDMAQGPQPPMMPPEMAGGMPPEMMGGMPGAEMAPPPQDGGIAALMGGAGGVPPGMPPGMPPEMAGGMPPVQMARGGYVQRFSEGSDEDGVTPSEEGSSSLGFRPTPDMVEMARNAYMNTLSQQPLAVPDLKSEASRRAEMYRDILGDNTDSRQAQMLMSLGQRAFNFAGNVDDQGRPLRGSFASRLAGAARSLPAEMSQFISAADKEQRQLKLMGVQAAEKEIEGTKASNLKLLETQRKAYADILKASGKGADSPFGKGLTGRSMEMFVQYAPLYAEGKLDPEAERYFLTAVKNYTQPTIVTVTDPLTQLTSQQERRNELPDFVATALQMRPPRAERALTAAPPAAQPGMPAAEVMPSAGAPAAQVTPVQPPEVMPFASATPADIPEEVAPMVQSAPEATFFDLSASGTGFVPVVVSGIARNVPISAAGRIRPEFQQATGALESMRNRVVNALQENPRFPEGERKMILNELKIGPRVLANRESYINQLVALDNVFDGLAQRAISVANEPKTGLTNRRDAEKKLQDINQIRDLLGVQARKINNTEE